MFNVEYNLDKDIDREVIRERSQLDPIYELIETYISEQPEDSYLLLSGNIATVLMLQEPRTHLDYVYEAYTRNPFKHANNLINRIAEFIAEPSRRRIRGGGSASNQDLKQAFTRYSLVMKTYLADAEYRILYMNRTLVVFKIAPDNLYQIAVPITVTGYYGIKMSCISPEINLMTLYRILYSPSQVDRWEQALINERRLFRWFKNRRGVIKRDLDVMDSSKVAIIPSMFDFESAQNEPVHGGSDDSRISRKSIVSTIYRHFIVNNKNVVLIGDFALIQMGFAISNPVLQIIYNGPTEKLHSEIMEVLKSRGVGLAKLPATVINLSLLDDLRISRASFKSDTDIMYSFNCAEYDLIPFSRKNHGTDFIQIGNPFVISRFLLVDYYIIKNLSSKSLLKIEYTLPRIQKILELLINLHNQVLSRGNSCFQSNGIFGIFGLENYVGSYVSDVTHKKNVKIKDVSFRDYYPFIYRESNPAFREL